MWHYMSGLSRTDRNDMVVLRVGESHLGKVSWVFRLDFEAFDERIMSHLIFERRVHKRTHYCWNANGHIMLCWFALPCSFNFFRNFNPEMKEKNAQYVLRTKKRFCLQTLLLSSKAPENYSSSCNLKRPHSMTEYHSCRWKSVNVHRK